MKFALTEMQLSSTAFEHGAGIPTQFTGDGEDVSPPLQWRDAPEGTASFSVICYGPDAPVIHLDGTIGFTHWLLYNLPGDLQSIGAAHDGHCTGVNDFGYTGYAGPMPPPNHGDHRYFFFLFALSSSAGFPPRLGLRQFVSALEPYTLGISRLMGVYSR